MASQRVGGDGEFVGRRVSIDWLDLTSKRLEVEGLLAICERILGPNYGESGIEVLRDDDQRFAAKGPLGMYVHADLLGSINRDGVREPWAGLQFPGDACQAIGSELLWDILREVRSGGGIKVSRLDLALDDFDKSFTPRFFAEEFVNGRLDDEKAKLATAVVTRVKGNNWNWSRKKGGCFWVGGDQSDRRLRVYDKDRESGGEIPSTRVELQMRDAYAWDAVSRVLDGGGVGEMARVFFSCLVSLVDLREPMGARSKSNEWPQRRWWAEFVARAERVSVSRRDDSGVWAWMRAMQRQVSGFMLVLLRAAGFTDAALMRFAGESPRAAKLVGVVLDAVGGSGGKLSPTHRVRLEQLRDERSRQAQGYRTPE